MAHRPLTAALITSLALLGAVPSTSIAQPADAQTRPTVGVNVDFPGGTMEAYVEALRASSATPINVIFRNEAASLAVPKVQLRNVSVGTALEVAIPQRGAWVEMNDDGTMTEYIRGIDIIDAHPPAVPAGYLPEPAFVINARERVRPQTKPLATAQPTRIEIFALGESVDGQGQTRDLLHAVDLALDLAESPQKAEIKLHEDTMLLIARGTDAQIEAVNDVILRMQDNRANRLRLHQNRARLVSPLRAEMIEQRTDVQELEIKRDLLAQKLSELNRLVGQGVISASEPDLRQTEGELRISDSRLEGARARLQATSEELAALMGDDDFRSEAIERAYSTPDVRANARILGVLRAVDSISGHIRSVESGKDGSPTSIEVHADEEGHRVVSRIVAAMSKGP